jgi:hypothetical protein
MLRCGSYFQHYVIWGHSEAAGHDRLDTAPKLMNGEKIWVVDKRLSGLRIAHFHLNGQEQAQLGRMMARAMP